MTKQQLDAIIAKLALDYPDSDTLLSVECFADWLTKYQRETEVTGCAEGGHCFIGAKCFHCGVSVTGRKPSQPEYQSFRPSSLPKWECAGDSTPRQHNPTVSVPGMFGDLSRYNKDRTPAEVYKATAEQVINQSRSYPSNPVVTSALSTKQIRDMMRTEWVHELEGIVTSFCPATRAEVAVLCNGVMIMGTLYVRGMLQGEDAVRTATAYLCKLALPRGGK